MQISRTISISNARELDRLAVEAYGMTGAMLMENAGRGAADVLCKLGIAGPVLVVCGRGNNGGDGFVIARHLDLRGYDVRVALLTEPGCLAGDAKLNYGILAKCGLPLQRWDGQESSAKLYGLAWIVDAILGTGARGEPREPYASAIDTLNRQDVPILAVDVPSGLDCESGIPSAHTIRASQTCTFVAAKPGMLLASAKPCIGELHVADIGAPRKLVERYVTQGSENPTSP